MKLERVAKLDKRNKTTLKKIYDDAILVNYDVIVKPDSGRIVCKTYTFIDSNL